MCCDNILHIGMPSGYHNNLLLQHKLSYGVINTISEIIIHVVWQCNLQHIVYMYYNLLQYTVIYCTCDIIATSKVMICIIVWRYWEILPNYSKNTTEYFRAEG